MFNSLWALPSYNVSTPMLSWHNWIHRPTCCHLTNHVVFMAATHIDVMLARAVSLLHVLGDYLHETDNRLLFASSNPQIEENVLHTGREILNKTFPHLYIIRFNFTFYTYCYKYPIGSINQCYLGGSLKGNVFSLQKKTYFFRVISFLWTIIIQECFHNSYLKTFRNKSLKLPVNPYF